MIARHHNREGLRPLPLNLIAQAIPMLSRHELAALADRLICALDSTEPDCDLEDSHDREAIDEREPKSEGGAGFWDIDQRYCVMDASLMESRVNVDAFPR